MTKKITLWIIFAFAASIGMVIILFALSGLMRDRHGSFLRQFPPHPAMEGDTLNIKLNSYYLAGGTPHHIYLGNYKAPLHLLVLNMALTDTQHVVLKVKGLQDQKFWAAQVLVDSPYYYFTDGAVPVMFKGNVHDWHSERYLYDSVYFRSITPMKPGSFAVKSLSGSTQENILGKITAWAPYQRFRNDILQKQLDGVFCTDGLLHYNKELNLLVYSYFYRNQFIVMDTSLNVLNQGNTIDTVSKAKIKTTLIASENSRTLSSPPYFVNRWSAVSNNWLFVNSSLMAKNESAEAFDQGAVIDMYDLKSGGYKFSFYVYDFEGRGMTEFGVFGDKMVVRYSNIIRVYNLRPKYFNK
jgi:hypothetical protein